MEHPTTNSQGFVKFEERSSAFRGDSLSWALVANGELIVKKANAPMSEAFQHELEEFCHYYKIRLRGMKPGEHTRIKLEDN